jgi:class 3 adenylate cyclase/predicted ATPase
VEATVDVAAWLKNLGLGQYQAAFRDNAIDGDLLPSLTAEDLRDLGVMIVGHRRKLLDAIAALGAALKPGLPPAAAEALATLPAPASRSQPRSGVDAERRPITVMFCDLVGSTALASRLDAEDWRSLVNAYLDEASTAVTGLGGHVLKKLGDGLMALFGYPKALENDAERAVRAALAIQRALGELNARNAARRAPELTARIGLESGLVVVDATGEVFGEAPNVAARVQAAAEPGTVLITSAVQRQVAGLFVAEEQGARELKGVAEPVQLFRIVRASGGGRRGGVRALTPFVGREEELSLLMRRWERARAGEGQLVLIVGEPGLGKSRLIEEFHTRLTETPHTWVEWSASQLLQNTPLHPVSEWGRQRFGVDVPAVERLADLESTLRLIGLDPVEHAPLLAPLVDVPLPPGRAANFPPEELRRRQLSAMTTWVIAGARSQPVVLAFEDLHWADPTSLDLLRALADRGAQAPLLFLATTRPEFRLPWSLRSHQSLISLSPLDRAGVARMVGEISARHGLSKEVIEGVNERTGGVPLFVEEVTRLLLERGEQGGVQAIPPSLQLSLAARLDRLGSAREVAQIGAVMGRGFSYSLLRDVGDLDEARLQSSLDRLADADLLFVEGAPPQADYRFKHALIQDAAYDSLLKSRRQALHRRAAEVLRDEPERAVASPEVIAHHFTQAGLDDLAIEWWGKAGDQALRRSAFQEALAHLGKAIDMADKATAVALRGGGENVATSSQRAKLQSDYSQAMMWSKGYATEETKAALARAAELAERTDDFSGRFTALAGQFAAAATRGELRSARELALTLLRKAEDAGRVREAGMANFMLGLIAYWYGDFVEARARCERALDALDPNPDPKVRERDHASNALSFLAATMWQLGEVERARELINSATQRAFETGHSGAIADALFWKSYLEIWRGDPLTTLSAAKALETLAREHAMTQFVSEAELHSGWARGRINDPMAGAAQVRRVLAAFVDQGVRVNLGFYSGLLAQLEAEMPGADSALARIDEALRLSNQVEHRCSLPFLHRVRGEILLKRDPADPAPAEDAYRTAIAIADEQGARSQALQAALTLAKLYQSTGRSVEAHAVLSPALEGFSPTQEMPEIAEAQATLAALAETEEVRAAEAHRQRLLHLQTGYSQALMWSKGYVAEETRAAFARVGELAAHTENNVARSQTRNAQLVGSIARGEMDTARKNAESFLRETEAAGHPMEAAHARRLLGGTCFYQGELALARGHFEQALAGYKPEWDMDVRHLFGADTRILSTSYLAMSTWLLGDIDYARRLIEQAVREANASDDVITITQVYFFEAMFEAIREHPAATRSAGERACDFSREHGVAFFETASQILSAWARGRLLDPATGAKDLRGALALYVRQGNKLWTPLFHSLTADLEGIAGRSDVALESVDAGIALAEEEGERWMAPALFRRKGEILLKRDPPNPAPAEEAFQSAVAIAKEQGARSWGLQAALSLAKLYQSTGRLAEAHAVLVPALEGFSPTPEMPEIAEAISLSARLALVCFGR